MRFYLGTHKTGWLGELEVPLFVSHRRLVERKGLPRATAPWGLDSGGFTEISTYGSWQTTARAYAEAARVYAGEIGSLEFAAPQDWMCEPWIVDRTGLSVVEHQRRTVASVLELRELAPEVPFVPVLQGWVLADYLRCVDLYGEAGIDLASEPLIGLGSVCRRQALSAAEEIVLALRPLRLHGFGMKVTGLKRYGYLLASSDSMAWSYAGRRRGPCSTGSSRCQNHRHFALEWRDRVLSSLEFQQTHLEGVA